VRRFIRLFIVFSAALFPLFGCTARAQFVIHVIDVGQSDAILVELKSGAILIDAGGESTSDDHYREHFLAALNGFFAKREDLKKNIYAVIVTHPHIDHTRLLMEVFQNFTVKHFYDGGDDKGRGAPQLKKAREYAIDHKIEYTAIEDKAIGKEGFTPPGLKKFSSGADVRFLTGSRGCANPNNNSLVVRVHYGGKTALLTGDSETDDDEDCEEGQVEYLLERYQGTDLLRADVYKVGHHASHNGTDQAFISAVSPAIAVISAGRKETKGPGPFHGFFFGHPREDVVELLEATTGNRNPPVIGYTYLKGTKYGNATDATDAIIEGRLITKAIYCTCWDGDVTIDLDKGNGELAVDASDRRPINQGGQPGPTMVAEPNLQPSAQPFRFANLGSNDGSNPSLRQRTVSTMVFFVIPILIYVLMRGHEIRQERVRGELAAKLIMKLREGGWKFTRFELGAWIRSRHAEDREYWPLWRRFWRFVKQIWPRPRVSINEVVEQAVGELITGGQHSIQKGDEKTGESKALIKKLQGLHSAPNNPTDLSGPLPSTRFLVAAVPMVVLFLAIQEVPSVGRYLADLFGHNSLLEELWTGLLATLVGTGATLLRRRSVQGRQNEKPSTGSQPEGQKQEGGTAEAL
jgi:beta-lactamase superfamily II metal-dependent hydrolase